MIGNYMMRDVQVAPRRIPKQLLRLYITYAVAACMQ